LTPLRCSCTAAEQTLIRNNSTDTSNEQFSKQNQF
jgi:hypothetical protein